MLGKGAGLGGIPPAEGAPPGGTGYLRNLKHDLPASVVVFLVALPLCLGIAIASGAPPLAGLVSGIVGGLVVAWVSGSAVAVSGPAAGLITIVLSAIAGLGYEGFLLAVVVAGAVQILLGLLKAGVFAYYFPSSVIKGMLAAIGVILILKQIPHALGYDEDFEGDLTLYWNGDLGAWHEISFAFEHIHLGAAIIAALGLVVLLVWERVDVLKGLRWMPGPLAVVLLGIGLNAIFLAVVPQWGLDGNHLVSLPSGGFVDLASQISFPDFSRIFEAAIWQTGFVIAAVASIETLLCLEALDKLDPFKRRSPVNRELVAQGVGNMIAGLLGGLPLTAVIVRGSANIQSGARTRLSAVFHGGMLLFAIVVLPTVMGWIPLAALAAILLHIGYKLARVEVFRKLFGQETGQWAPFVTTIVAVVATDLLTGVGIGMGVAVFFILRANLQVPYFIHHSESHKEEGHRRRISIELSENVSFLNKASVSKVLHELPAGTVVKVDASSSHYIHADVLELIEEFAATAAARSVEVELIGLAKLAPPKEGTHETTSTPVGSGALRHYPAVRGAR
ncbi:MAG: SulP family inorganic anion transporter [Deltaproteobacteria bacterium]|nr:MAG: SulP family inorganic anion transporter [Deltaproteobacteria bacterium]